MRVFSPLLFGLVGLLCTDLALAAKVYKWTDEKGITHFSEHPPLNTKTTVVKPQISLGESAESSSSAASSVGSRQASSESLAAIRAAAKINPQRCADAKTNVESLKTYTHIKIKEGDSYRFLTPEEQQQKLNEANQAIAESCAP